MESPTAAEIDLLPGTLGPDAVPVRPVADAHSAIRRARRRALFHDVVDTGLLAAIDAVYLLWAPAHIPLLTREETLVVLAGVHFLMLGYFFAVRKMPVWRARRIASTWCRAERARFRA